MAQPVVGEMEMQCCQLCNIADPFSNFFTFKKAPKRYLVSENSAMSCFPNMCTPPALALSLSLSLALLLSLSLSLSLSLALSRSRSRSLSLSLSLSASALFSELRREAALYVASLILHASIAEITAQLSSLSCVYLISSDDGSIIRIFCAD